MNASAQAPATNLSNSIPRQNSLVPAPLTIDQRRIWFLHEMDPDLIHFNISQAFRVRGEFNPSYFEQGMRFVVGRHEILRTTFADTPDGPIQVVGPVAVDLQIVDMTGAPEAERYSLAMAEIDRLARDPFDLANGPLFRCTLFKLGVNDLIIGFCVHHIVADFESLKIILKEVFEFYRCAQSSREINLPELPIQYRDYASWQNQRIRSGALSSQLDYWKQRLAACRT